MKTLLIHEWLESTGGAENVSEHFREIFPTADEYCLWNDAPRRFGKAVHESWIAATPLRKTKVLALPFMPFAWRWLKLDGYDRLVSSSHAFGHHVASRAARRGLSAYAYVHTPARYVWAPEFDPRGRRLPARLARPYFRRLDRAAASQDVKYAANSKFVAKRIEDAWDVPARVIHPPVDVELLQSVGDWKTAVTLASEMELLDRLPDRFVLGASRLVAYKRLDVAIEVGSKLGVPVIIAGRGPDEPRLRALSEAAKVPVIFIGRPSSELLHALYQAASLFVFMSVEDFGIMPVEAMSLGTPVLVNPVGGASESVELIRGGAVVEPDSPEVGWAAASVIDLEMAGARARARTFSVEQFRAEVDAWISDGA